MMGQNNHSFFTACAYVYIYIYIYYIPSNNLSWSLQVESVCSKARRVLGLLYRWFCGQASQQSLKQIYLSLIRLHLECACQVQDLHLAKDISTLEKFKSSPVATLAISKWDSSYEELLSLMEIKQLKDRRHELKLGLYNVQVGTQSLSFPGSSWSHCQNCRSNRNSNSLQLLRPLAHTNAYMHSCFHTLHPICELTGQFKCYCYIL